MGQALSMDLRGRLLAAIDDGMSCRAAAVRFGVAPSTAIRWHDQRRTTGTFAPKPQGGDTRSRRIEERRAETSADHLPVIPGGGNLFFQLVNARYEKEAMRLRLSARCCVTARSI